jgi:hypothetical protein
VIHRLTLRQITANPSLMSDEVFVPEEEVDELVEELERVRNILIEYRRETAWETAYAARSKIVWLENELRISKYNERAALDCLAQSNRHLHGGSCDGKGEARKAPGTAGTVEERADVEGQAGTNAQVDARRT